MRKLDEARAEEIKKQIIWAGQCLSFNPYKNGIYIVHAYMDDSYPNGYYYVAEFRSGKIDTFTDEDSLLFQCMYRTGIREAIKKAREKPRVSRRDVWKRMHYYLKSRFDIYLDNPEWGHWSEKFTGEISSLVDNDTFQEDLDQDWVTEDELRARLRALGKKLNLEDEQTEWLATHWRTSRAYPEGCEVNRLVNSFEYRREVWTNYNETDVDHFFTLDGLLYNIADYYLSSYPDREARLSSVSSQWTRWVKNGELHPFLGPHG